jgi:hypothetical protein
MQLQRWKLQQQARNFAYLLESTFDGFLLRQRTQKEVKAHTPIEAFILNRLKDNYIV